MFAYFILLNLILYLEKVIWIQNGNWYMSCQVSTYISRMTDVKYLTFRCLYHWHMVSHNGNISRLFLYLGLERCGFPWFWDQDTIHRQSGVRGCDLEQLLCLPYLYAHPGQSDDRQTSYTSRFVSFVCLISCLTSTVNNWGHVGMVIYPNHTFLGRLNISSMHILSSVKKCPGKGESNYASRNTLPNLPTGPVSLFIFWHIS